MSEKISFIHAADLHLDSPFKGLAELPDHTFKQIRESTFSALDQLVSTAVSKQVDFVLLVGDLFDNEKQGLKAQVRLRRAFERLQTHGINVYLSYGNHDFIKGNNHTITYPANVFIFPDYNVTHFIHEKKDGTRTAIYGFSYRNRAVREKMVQKYIKTEDTIHYHIAMLHGSLHTNTEHDVYAPFKLAELTEKDFDYWALGHIHQRQILHNDPPVIYPGNIQGRNRKETGEKGCMHVTLSSGKPDLEFIPTQELIFSTRKLDVSSCTEVHQVEQLVRDALVHTQNETPELLELTLTSTSDYLGKWDAEQLIEEVVELVNESSAYRDNWKYIFRYTIEREFSGMEEELKKGEHFAGELIRYADDVSILPYLKELQSHKQARKYLGNLDSAQKESIRHRAKQLLVHELLKDGND